MSDRATVRGWAAIRVGHNDRYPPWPDWESFSEESPEDARQMAEKEDAESEWAKAHPILRIAYVEIREIEEPTP